MKQITREFLVSLNVCRPQLELFDETFPNGADWTENNYGKAVAVGLNLDWLASKMFLCEYEEKVGVLKEKYAAAKHACYDEYISKFNSIDESLRTAEESRKEAWLQYVEQISPILEGWREQVPEAIKNLFFPSWFS